MKFGRIHGQSGGIIKNPFEGIGDPGSQHIRGDGGSAVISPIEQTIISPVDTVI